MSFISSTVILAFFFSYLFILSLRSKLGIFSVKNDKLYIAFVSYTIVHNYSFTHTDKVVMIMEFIEK